MKVFNYKGELDPFLLNNKPSNKKNIKFYNAEEYYGDINEDLVYNILISPRCGFDELSLKRTPNKGDRFDYVCPALRTAFEVKSSLKKNKYWDTDINKMFPKKKIQYFFKQKFYKTLVLVFKTRDKIGFYVLRKGINDGIGKSIYRIPDEFKEGFRLNTGYNIIDFSDKFLVPSIYFSTIEIDYTAYNSY